MSLNKKGSPPPAPPAGYVPSKPVRKMPAPPEGYVPNSPNQHGSIGGVSVIKALQQAILNFANTASATDITSMQGNQQSQMEDPHSKEFLGGSDPFGNFLVGNYLDKSDPVGHQYVNSDVSGQNREGAGANQNTNLRGIIDSIKRVGTPGAENKPDGIWMNRTNNALKNIYAVAYAMFHFATDMNLNLPGLDDRVLSNFQSMIPASYDKLSNQERVEIAPKLTEMVNDVSKTFAAFKKYVLENKETRAYIDQKKSFYKFKKEDKSIKNPLDQNDKALLSNNQPIPGVTVSHAKNPKSNFVVLNDLVNIDNFKSMIHRMGLNPDDPSTVKKVYQEIMGHLGGIQTNADPAADPGY